MASAATFLWRLPLQRNENQRGENSSSRGTENHGAMCRVRYFVVSTKTWHSAAFPSHAYLAEMAHCTGCHSPMPRVVLFFHRVNTGFGGKMKIRALTFWELRDAADQLPATAPAE